MRRLDAPDRYSRALETHASDRDHATHPQFRHSGAGYRSRRRFDRGPPVPDRGRTRIGQDHARHAVPAGGGAQGRESAVHHPLRNGRGTAGDRPVAWMGPRRRGGLRIAGTQPQARGRCALHHVPSLGDRAGRDHRPHPQAGGNHQAAAPGVRLARGTPPDVGICAALPPARALVQAVARGAALHHLAARSRRRPRLRPHRAHHRAWRHQPVLHRRGLRRGPPSRARGQVSRPPRRRRLP